MYYFVNDFVCFLAIVLRGMVIIKLYSDVYSTLLLSARHRSFVTVKEAENGDNKVI